MRISLLETPLPLMLASAWFVITLAAPMLVDKQHSQLSTATMEGSPPDNQMPLASRKRKQNSSKPLLPRHLDFYEDVAKVKWHVDMNAQQLLDAFRNLLDKHKKTTGGWAMKQLRVYLLENDVRETTVNTFTQIRTTELRRISGNIVLRSLASTSNGRLEERKKRREKFSKFLTSNGFHFGMSPKSFDQHWDDNNDEIQYTRKQFGARLKIHMKHEKVSEDWQEKYRRLHRRTIDKTHREKYEADIKSARPETSESWPSKGKNDSSKVRFLITKPVKISSAARSSVDGKALKRPQLKAPSDQSHHSRASSSSILGRRPEPEQQRLQEDKRKRPRLELHYDAESKSGMSQRMPRAAHGRGERVSGSDRL